MNSLACSLVGRKPIRRFLRQLLPPPLLRGHRKFDDDNTTSPHTARYKLHYYSILNPAAIARADAPIEPRSQLQTGRNLVGSSGTSIRCFSRTTPAAQEYGGPQYTDAYGGNAGYPYEQPGEGMNYPTANLKEEWEQFQQFSMSFPPQLRPGT